MKLKATTYFISKGGCNFTESYRVSPHVIKILVLWFQSSSFRKALLETQFPIQCPLSVDLLETHQ